MIAAQDAQSSIRVNIWFLSTGMSDFFLHLFSTVFLTSFCFLVNLKKVGFSLNIEFLRQRLYVLLCKQ